MTRSLGRALLATALLLAVVLIGSWAFVRSGTYPIGADEPHTAPVLALMTMLREHSVRSSARDVKPRDIRDEKLIASGAKNYAEMCVGCHLAPGVTKSELREGLYPQPPNLSRPGDRDPKETFWVIKHGIKMSAMPAWGRSHDDDAIWAMVAFISSMPTMPVARYQQLAGAASAGHGMSHGEQRPSMAVMHHGQAQAKRTEPAKPRSTTNRQAQHSTPGMDHGRMGVKQPDSAKGHHAAAQRPQGALDKPAQTPPATIPDAGKSVSPAFEGYRPYNAQVPAKEWRSANQEVGEAGGHVGMARGAQGAGHGEHATK